MKVTNLQPKSINTSIYANTLWQVLPILIGLISVPYSIKFYDLELFSIYALSIGFIVGLNYLHFGVATNTNRDLSQLKNNEFQEKSKIFWSAFIAMIGISIILMILLYIILPIYIENINASKDIKLISNSFFKLVILQIPIVLIIILFRSVLESEMQFTITSSNRAILNSMLLVSPLITGFLGLNFLIIAIVLLVFHLLSLLYLSSNLISYLTLPLPEFKKNYFIKIIKSGSSLTLISLGMLVFLYSDRFILSVVADMKEVALFIVPLDILMRISFIYGSIGAVFFPIFSKTLAQKDPLKFLSLYNKSYFLIFSLVGLIICFLVLFSSELLSLWLGSDFDSHELSIIIAIAIMFTGLTVIPGRALISLKKEKMLGIFYLAGSLLYIPSSYLLINTYGVNGAAYAFLSRSIIELFVLNILVAYSMKKIFVERTVKYVKLSLYSFLPLIFFFIAFLSNIDVLYKILILFLVMIIACSIIYKIFKSLDSLKINT